MSSISWASCLVVVFPGQLGLLMNSLKMSNFPLYIGVYFNFGADEAITGFMASMAFLFNSCIFGRSFFKMVDFSLHF